MSEVFNFIYRGGVSKENNIRYLTANTPPADDNSNKVPTTEWVKNNMPSVPSGNIAIWSRNFTTGNSDKYTVVLKAPSGGTYFCFGEAYVNTDLGTFGISIKHQTVSGGAIIGSYSKKPEFVTANSVASVNGIAIKIA